MTDSIVRFWDRYILKITEQNVPEGARRWYVRHVEAFFIFVPVAVWPLLPRRMSRPI